MYNTSVQSAKAKERQATSTGGSNPQLVHKFAQAEQTKTRDMVAEKLGIGSGETYRKEKYHLQRKNTWQTNYEAGKTVWDSKWWGSQKCGNQNEQCPV